MSKSSIDPSTPHPEQTACPWWCDEDIEDVHWSASRLLTFPALHDALGRLVRGEAMTTVHVGLDEGGSFVWVDGGSGPLTSQEAREFASTLVAAAERAENVLSVEELVALGQEATR